MSKKYRSKALWQCQDCNQDGVVYGVVVVSPNTVDGPSEAEFYADKEESGLYFAGCIYCGSEDVNLDDVHSVA